MASKIKGITIEIGGDVTKLDKALNGVNKQVRSTQSELREVEKLLKLDPKNTELLAQKQTLLKDAIGETKDKLDILKTAEAQVQEQFKKGDATEEQYRAIQREIIETEEKLKSLEDEAKNFGSVSAQKIEVVGEKMSNLGGEIEEAGKKFTPFSAAAAGVLTGSAVLASNFEDAVAKVGTVADTSSVSLDTLRADMLNLSTQTGKSATEIADATYQAISASVDTADAVSFVETATNLAKAGFLETSDAVDVLTTIINAYGLSADEAASLSDKLIQTQNDGKTTVNELSSSMGQVIPLASAYGVDIDNLCTSYAQLTKNGVATAQAGTYLKSMLNELGDSGSDVSKILQEKTGNTFGQLMEDGNSLGDVLGILKDSVDGDSEAFAGLWGSSEAGTGALSLTSAGIEAFNDELGNMGDSISNTSDALETLDTSSAKSKRAINALKNTGIQLGQTALTAITPLIEKFSVVIQNLATRFGNLNPGIQQAIVVILAVVAAIGPALMIVGKVITAVSSVIGVISKIGPAIKAAKTAFSAFNAVLAANPIILVVTAIVALIAIFVTLYKKCEWFRDGVNAIWEAIKSAFMTAFGAIKSFFTETLPNAFNSVVNFVKKNWQGLLLLLVNPFAGAFKLLYDNCEGFRTTIDNLVTKIKNFFQGLKDKIVEIFSGIGKWFSDRFTEAYTGIKKAFSNVTSFFSDLWSKIKNCFVDVGTKIGSAVGNAFKNAINRCLSTIEGVINKFIGMINGVIGIINKIPGVELGKISTVSLPRLAKGGVLREGSAIMAEAGPELVSMVNGRTIVTPLTNTARNTALDSAGAAGGSGGFVQNNYYTSPKALSPSECARQTRNATRNMILQLQGG